MKNQNNAFTAQLIHRWSGEVIATYSVPYSSSLPEVAGDSAHEAAVRDYAERYSIADAAVPDGEYDWKEIR